MDGGLNMAMLESATLDDLSSEEGDEMFSLQESCLGGTRTGSLPPPSPMEVAVAKVCCYISLLVCGCVHVCTYMASTTCTCSVSWT